MLLNEEGKKEFLKTKFHQFFDIRLQEIESINENGIEQFVNFVLPLEKINEYFILSEIRKIFNDDYNNVIFTPADDYESIYKYEFYGDRFFIRMKPFSTVIRMHIVPKKYDASNATTDDNLLFFKDKKQKINNKNFSCTAEYKRQGKNINLYYQEQTEKPSNGFYKFDIKKYTQNMRNLQINYGYSYNDTNPTNKIWHLTGIIDESDEQGNKITSDNFTEFNSSLVDANCDNRLNKTNKIIQLKIDNQIDWENYYTDSGGFNNRHGINTVYHKTLKYFNDDLYTEENSQYYLVDWVERREE